MGDLRRPPAPRGLKAAGRRLWHDVLGRFDLDEHELLLLREACRTVDALDRLTAEAERAGPTVTNHKGDQVTHPALVEARQQRITLARLLASLRLPSGDEDTRPQRRGAARGTYGIRGSA